MILVGTNLLLYAYDSSSRHHRRAAQWLARVIAEQPRVGLAWMDFARFPGLSLCNPLE